MAFLPWSSGLPALLCCGLLYELPVLFFCMHQYFLLFPPIMHMNKVLLSPGSRIRGERFVTGPFFFSRFLKSNSQSPGNKIWATFVWCSRTDVAPIPAAHIQRSHFRQRYCFSFLNFFLVRFRVFSLFRILIHYIQCSILWHIIHYNQYSILRHIVHYVLLCWFLTLFF